MWNFSSTVESPANVEVVVAQLSLPTLSLDSFSDITNHPRSRQIILAIVYFMTDTCFYCLHLESIGCLFPSNRNVFFAHELWTSETTHINILSATKLLRKKVMHSWHSCNKRFKNADKKNLGCLGLSLFRTDSLGLVLYRHAVAPARKCRFCISFSRVSGYFMRVL